MQSSTLILLIVANSAIAFPFWSPNHPSTLQARAAALAPTTFNEISIAGGTAGNCESEAAAKFSALNIADAANVDPADIQTLKAVNEIANMAEIGAYNPAIAAANTTGGDVQALNNGKVKNKCLKYTASKLLLTVQAAQGKDVAAKMMTEVAKLADNIALDKAAAGQPSTALPFDASTATVVADLAAAKTNSTSTTASAPKDGTNSTSTAASTPQAGNGSKNSTDTASAASTEEPKAPKAPKGSKNGTETGTAMAAAAKEPKASKGSKNGTETATAASTKEPKAAKGNKNGAETSTAASTKEPKPAKAGNGDGAEDTAAAASTTDDKPKKAGKNNATATATAIESGAKADKPAKGKKNATTNAAARPGTKAERALPVDLSAWF